MSHLICRFRKSRSAEIAEAEKIDRSFVSRLLRLTLLAPDIQEAILERRQAKGMQLEELMGAMPGEWGKQWEADKADPWLSGAGSQKLGAAYMRFL